MEALFEIWGTIIVIGLFMIAVMFLPQILAFCVIVAIISIPCIILYFSYCIIREWWQTRKENTVINK